MKTENFLRKVLASEGDYCVFASNLKRKNDVVQNFYTSIGDMVDGARDLDAKGYDAYFRLSLPMLLGYYGCQVHITIRQHPQLV
jgi:hypothetical protein